MAHSASIRVGAEYRYSASNHDRPVSQSVDLTERNRSGLSGGSARSLHDLHQGTPIVAGHSAGVLERDRQLLIRDGQVLTWPVANAFVQDRPGPVFSEDAIHAFVLDMRSRGRRQRTVRSYLQALWYWPVLWPTTAVEFAPVFEKIADVTPHTRKIYMTVWGTFGRFAQERLGLPNIVPELPHQPVPRTLRNIPSESNVKALIYACEDPRDRTLVHLLAGTGIRWGELPMLRSQVRGDHFYTQEGKTGMRMVPLPESVADSLRSIGDRQRLWLMDDGRPMTLSGLHMRFRRMRDRSRHLPGIDIHITPHLLRHFFAVQFLESGGDLRALQEILGHQDISTTAIYLTVTVRHLQASMKRHSPASRLTGEIA